MLNICDVVPLTVTEYDTHLSWLEMSKWKMGQRKKERKGKALPPPKKKDAKKGNYIKSGDITIG